MIYALGENNPILRDLLTTTKQEIHAASVGEVGYGSAASTTCA